jgi:FkbM family methyltransferase
MKISSKAKSYIRMLINLIGVDIHKKNSVNYLIKRLQDKKDFNFELLTLLPNMDSVLLIDYLRTSKSQNGQDLFALLTNEFKYEGCFIEVGATNGVALSNTFLLEKKFNWTGLVVEPAKIWHKELFENRNCSISTKCVFNTSGAEIIFNETKKRSLSTIDRFSNSDEWSESRVDGKKYSVETITLNDLIQEFKLPDFIDFLSIDTEGSEFDILSAFDFSRYKFRAISCEHNYTNNREKIYSLLIKNGYRRVFENLSLGDDWYVYSPASYILN